MFNIRNVGNIFNVYIFREALYRGLWVCVSVCLVCVFGECVCVCIWVFLDVCVVWVCMCSCLCGVCVCVYIRVCVCVFCLDVCGCVCAHVCVCVCVGYLCVFSIHGQSLAIKLLRNTFKSTSISLRLTEMCHLMISEAVTASFCHFGGRTGRVRRKPQVLTVKSRWC